MMHEIKLEKQCKTCEFYLDGACTSYGDTYKHGEKISDDTKTCTDWEANSDYYTYITTNAPRFLREPLNDCKISYNQFLEMLDNYAEGKEIPINIFDAVKLIYGISIVDIAVLMGVSFGVVYRAKTQGIPAKRVMKFAEVLGVSPDLLMTTTTKDFERLKKAKEVFWARPNIETQLDAMPEWKQELTRDISFSYLHCPIHLARDFSRVDKLFWTSKMPIDGFTESEKRMIAFVTRATKRHMPVIKLEFSLDIACKPHMMSALIKNHED